MGLSDRQDTPGQPMDPIALASVGISLSTSHTRNANVSIGNDENRQEERHLLREGPFLIADYLAQNSSKSAAVFRRYDKLAIHRLISLSKDLRSLEKEHDQCVDDGEDLEESNVVEFSEQAGSKLREYCTRLLHIRTIGGVG